MRGSAACLLRGAIMLAAAVGVVAAIELRDRGVWLRDELTVRCPFDGAVFPPDIAPPTFRWSDPRRQAGAWRIDVEFADGRGGLAFRSGRPEWTPAPHEWEAIKRRSREADAVVTIRGVRPSSPDAFLSVGHVTIRTSADPVDAPIFYREVNLPFIDAVKDPTNIRWRFGAVSSPDRPRLVLTKLPVCGNCHSFSRDGRLLAMDVDYANSKGSYVITRVAPEMTLATTDIITWNDYRKADGEQTFGLLSQVSPDGRFVLSTVKDKSVFVPMPELAFSQLFFPVKGILAVYRRDTGTFHALPGADDPKYVQSNPTWSPDGKRIVFARTEAYDLKDTKGKGKVLLTREECREFTEDGKPFRFNLYSIPFNDGAGGKAEPIEGASHNGMSNYFPKFSPDGRWIVFCKARSYMLLQPDSELYIIPAAGGEARRLRCNTGRMNSWHSWSPNGRWLVFSSKAFTPYTQLFLTHVDEQGRTTPAVLLDRFTDRRGAANIPEFVNASPTAIRKIHERFLDDYSYVRAGNQFFMAGDGDAAIREYEKALALNADSAEAHLRLGFLLYNYKAMRSQGMTHLLRALALDPDDGRVYHDLGMAMLTQGRFDEAIRYLSEALRRMPNGLDSQYTAYGMRTSLGQAYLYKGQVPQAVASLTEAVRLAPDNATAHYRLALALAVAGKIDEPLLHYRKAVELDPAVDRSAVLHRVLAINCYKAGRKADAVTFATKALALARAEGKAQLAARIEAELKLFRQGAP